MNECTRALRELGSSFSPFEPRQEETGHRGFQPGLTQSQKKARSLKYRINEEGWLYYL